MAKRISGKAILTATLAGDADTLRSLLAPGGAAVEKMVKSVGLKGITAALERGRDDLAVLPIDAGATLHELRFTTASAQAKIAQ